MSIKITDLYVNTVAKGLLQQGEQFVARTTVPLSMWAGANHSIRSAIRSATGNSRRNFRAPTRLRATPS